MYSIKSDTPLTPDRGEVRLSFSEPQGWLDLPHPGLDDAKLAALLLGDEFAGPLVWLSALPPRTEPVHLSPAHGHDCDNWRISIKGVQHMGAQAYAEGEFRFQHGGAPYGPDDYAYGPDGGYGLILMADRRGFAVRTVDDLPAVDAAMVETGKLLGVEMLDPYPYGPAIRSTLGGAGRRAFVEGSFADTSKWSVLPDGRRLLTAILGDRKAGPVLWLLDAPAGARLFPACQLASELLLVVAGGDCTADQEILSQGDLRLREAGLASPALRAGSQGCSLIALAGDRRAVAGLSAGAAAEDAEDVATLVARYEELAATLGEDPGPRERRKRTAAAPA